MATYYVSGVWKDANDVITHLNVHLTNPKTVFEASKMSEKQVIALMANGHQVYTCNWNYQGNSYSRGAILQVVSGHLRSMHDKILTDNLDNMLRMDNLGA